MSKFTENKFSGEQLAGIYTKLASSGAATPAAAAAARPSGGGGAGGRPANENGAASDLAAAGAAADRPRADGGAAHMRGASAGGRAGPSGEDAPDVVERGARDSGDGGAGQRDGSGELDGAGQGAGPERDRCGLQPPARWCSPRCARLRRGSGVERLRGVIRAVADAEEEAGHAPAGGALHALVGTRPRVEQTATARLGIGVGCCTAFTATGAHTAGSARIAAASASASAASTPATGMAATAATATGAPRPSVPWLEGVLARARV